MRLHDWPERLAEAVEAAKSCPFEWGRHDCGIWVCEVAAVLTGQPSPADAWRGTYRTERGAWRAMKRQGWKDLSEAATAIFGDPIPVMRAQRGDVAIHDGCLGVVIGGDVACLRPDAGLTRVPLRPCAMAWRV